MSIRIPAPKAGLVEARIASMSDRDRFGQAWSYWPLTPSSEGFWDLDIDSLPLADGVYEYEFLLDGDRTDPVADPYAKEITKFGGYRGLLHVRDGKQWSPPFDWGGEIPPGVSLPENNRIVIYEMPMRWMEGEFDRQVGLGTFEKAAFMHLDRLAGMGINCVQLLPVQDSADTLNWGYGTRFFFTTDFDMGAPVDLRWFVKQCHRRGVRVLIDVVMNHARGCPLERLAGERFFVKRGEEPGRGDDYGGQMFRYLDPFEGRHWARLFHLDVARYWISEYHVDGFRIDEFKGIDNWDFIQQFRDAAWTRFRRDFPDRPFIVIAEDSATRSVAVHDDPGNPGKRRVVDAMWNFHYRDDARRLLLDRVQTEWGQASRTERIVALISGRMRWDDWSKRLDGGFSDLAQAVGYITSHDVEKDHERRFVNHAVMSELRSSGVVGAGFPQEREFELVQEIAAAARIDPPRPDGMAGQLCATVGLSAEAARAVFRRALDRARSAFALLLTSVNIPMLLAGEEFGDIHDTNHHIWQLKMSDPVDWYRQQFDGHRQVADAASDLIRLRTGHPALHRNEVDFFHFHPTIDQPHGSRVFAYCRTGGRPRGSGGQVVVVANLGQQDFPNYDIPWPWTVDSTERGRRAQAEPPRRLTGGWASLRLPPFDVRVFQT